MTRSPIAIPACLLVLSGGALILPGGALAQAAVSFESLDKNSDGKISLNEASGHDGLFVAFKGLDANKDGLLTREEFAAYQKRQPGA